MSILDVFGYLEIRIGCKRVRSDDTLADSLLNGIKLTPQDIFQQADIP
jgi:hypothetical protein